MRRASCACARACLQLAQRNKRGSEYDLCAAAVDDLCWCDGMDAPVLARAIVAKLPSRTVRGSCLRSSRAP